MLKLITLSVILIHLNCFASNKQCPGDLVPSSFQLSSTLNSVTISFQQYFTKQCPLTTNANLNSFLKITNVGYQLQQQQNILSGLIYPENITYTINKQRQQVYFKWYTNSSVMTSKYTLNLSGKSQDCGFAILDIDYGIYKYLPTYKIVGLCSQSSGQYRGYLLTKYRAQDSYKLTIMDPVSAKSINPKKIKTVYKYDGSSYSSVVSVISDDLTDFSYLLYEQSNREFILKNSQSLQQQLKIKIDLIGILYGLGDQGKTIAYLDRKGTIVFKNTEGTISTFIIVAQLLDLSFYKLCWSSVIAIYTGNFLYFIEYKENQMPLYYGSIATKQKLKFVTVGKYIVGFRGQQTHFYYLKKGQIFHKFGNLPNNLCFDCDGFLPNGLQQDLCRTNSFYFANYKVSIQPYSIHVNSNQTINFVWEDCEKNTTITFVSQNNSQNRLRKKHDPYFSQKLLEITLPQNIDIRYSCWIDIDRYNFLLIGQIVDSVNAYECNWETQCIEILKLQNQNLVGDCSLQTNRIEDVVFIHALFRGKKSSKYINLKKQNEKSLKMVFKMNLNDTIQRPQFLYEDYKDENNLEISYLAKTPVQNNAYCHYYIQVKDGQKYAKFNYPFQFQSFGYSYCVTDQLLLFYRSDPHGLAIKKAGLRQKRFYVLQDTITLQQYKGVSIICSKKGLGVYSDKIMHLLDSQLEIISDWKINQNWQMSSVKQTESFIKLSNKQSNSSHIYNKTSGFQIFSRQSNLLTSFGDTVCSQTELKCFKINSELHRTKLLFN